MLVRLSNHPFFRIFPAIMLPMFLAVIDQTIVSTALPAIATSLGSPERVSWVIVSYLVATTIAAPVYGNLGDSFGRRRMMMIGLAVFIGASLLCASATSIEWLTLARIVQGLGGGGLMTCAQALVGETVPPRERARYQGFLAAVIVSATTVGPVVGGLLTETFGWRSIFLASVPIGLLAMLIATRLPPPSGKPRRRRFDWLGLALFVAFVVPLLLGLEQARDFDTAGTLAVIGCLAISIAALVVLVRWERRIEAPLLPLSLLRRPALWHANALAVFHGGLIVSLITFLPLYMRVVRGMSAAESGLVLLPLTACVGLGSMITGWLVTRTGRTAAFPSWGMMVVSAGMIALVLVGDRLDVMGLTILLAVIGAFLGTTMGVVQVIVQFVAGPAVLGSAAGFVQFSRSIGAAIGTAVAAAVLFTVLEANGEIAVHAFGALLADGPSALAALPAPQQLAVETAVAHGFKAVFAALSVFAVAATLLAWLIPVRRI